MKIIKHCEDKRPNSGKIFQAIFQSSWYKYTVSLFCHKLYIFPRSVTIKNLQTYLVSL